MSEQTKGTAKRWSVKSKISPPPRTHVRTETPLSRQQKDPEKDRTPASISLSGGGVGEKTYHFIVQRKSCFKSVANFLKVIHKG